MPPFFFSPLQSGHPFVFSAAVNNLQSPTFVLGPVLESGQLNDFESSPKRMPTLNVLASISVLLQ